MALELGVAYMSIAASTGPLAKDVKRQFGALEADAARTGKDAGGKFSSGFKGALAVLGGLAILGTVAGQIGELATESIAASDATDKFKQTLGFAGLKTTAIDNATKAARAYADQTVYDLADIQNTTAQLAANGIKGFGKLTEAAGNLNAVAGGNAETFKSVGMVLTQTAGQGKLTTENWNQLADAIPGASGQIQQALLKNGAFTGNFRDAMSKGQITAEEFNQALLELGSKPVAVEAATSVKTFEGAVGNLKATIVGGLSDGLNAIKPAVTGVISAIATGIGTAFDKIRSFAGSLGRWVADVKSLFASVGGGIAGVSEVANSLGGIDISGLITAGSQILSTFSPLGLLFKSLQPLLPQLATAFASLAQQGLALLIPLIQQVAPLFAQVSATLVGAGTQIAATLLPVLMQLAQAIFPVIAKVIADVVPIVSSLVKSLLPLIGIAADLISSLLPPLAAAIEALIPAFMPVIDAVMEIVKALLPLVSVAVELIGQVLPPLAAVIKALLPPLVSVASIVFGQLAGALKLLAGLITALVGPIINFAKVVADKIAQVLTWFSTLPAKLTGPLEDLPGKLLNIGKDMIQGLINGARDMIGAAVAAITNIAGNIIDKAKDALGIHSPSKVFREIGLNLTSGLARGIGQGEGRALRAVEHMTALAASRAQLSIPAPTLASQGMTQPIIRAASDSAIAGNLASRSGVTNILQIGDKAIPLTAKAYDMLGLLFEELTSAPGLARVGG